MNSKLPNSLLDPNFLVSLFGGDMPIPMALTLANGSWYLCNKAWASRTGLTGDQTFEWGWTEALHPDDREDFLQAWRTGFSDGIPFEAQTRLLVNPGQQGRWHLCQAQPLNAGQGAGGNWIVTFTDVQALKEDNRPARQHKESELSTQIQGLKGINQHLFDQVKALQSQLEQRNKATEAMRQINETLLHLSRAKLDLDAFMDLVTQRLLALTPAQGTVVELLEGDEMVYRAAAGSVASQVGLRLKAENSLSGRCVFDNEIKISRDTSTDPRVDAQACRKVGAGSMIVVPLFEKSKPTGVLKVLARQANVFSEDDIQTLQLMAGLIGAAMGHQLDFQAGQRLLKERTEVLDSLREEIETRKQTERELLLSRERVRKILDNAYDAYVGLDQLGRIIDWNPQAEKMLGWSRDEAMGRKADSLIVPEQLRTPFNGWLQIFLETGNQSLFNRRIQTSVVTRHLDRVPVEMALAVIQTEGNWNFGAFLHDISERMKAEDELRHQAQYDSLTGLPNRSLFFDRLERAMARSLRHHSLMALMYLDVDRFKQINDTYGHAVGDELLKAFSQRVLETIRATDTLSRLGGDEFTLIAEGLDTIADAEFVAGKVIAVMASRFVLKGHEIDVSTSIGIAFYRVGAISREELIKEADTALYQAKSAGRNRFSLSAFQPSP